MLRAANTSQQHTAAQRKITWQNMNFCKRHTPTSGPHQLYNKTLLCCKILTLRDSLEMHSTFKMTLVLTSRLPSVDVPLFSLLWALSSVPLRESLPKDMVTTVAYGHRQTSAAFKMRANLARDNKRLHGMEAHSDFDSILAYYPVRCRPYSETMKQRGRQLLSCSVHASLAVKLSLESSYSMLVIDMSVRLWRQA